MLTDFDLFLYNRDEGIYAYGSQSVQDNNEGWDVTIIDKWKGGQYDVILAWPEDTPYCDGSWEKVAWSAIWWG